MKIYAYIGTSFDVDEGLTGWAYMIDAVGDQNEILKSVVKSGTVLEPTLNRAQLRSAIECLKAFTKPTEINLMSTSRFVVDGAQTRLEEWKSEGWPCRDADLWQEFDAVIEDHSIIWSWQRHAKANQALDYVTVLSADALKQAQYNSEFSV